jgi:hypothetical protein
MRMDKLPKTKQLISVNQNLNPYQIFNTHSWGFLFVCFVRHTEVKEERKIMCENHSILLLESCFLDLLISCLLYIIGLLL